METQKKPKTTELSKLFKPPVVPPRSKRTMKDAWKKPETKTNAK